MDQQEKRAIISKSIYSVLDVPLVQEAIKGLSTIAQKKLGDRFEQIIDRYTADPNYTITEGNY